MKACERLIVEHILFLLTKAKTKKRDNKACAIAHIKRLLVERVVNAGETTKDT